MNGNLPLIVGQLVLPCVAGTSLSRGNHDEQIAAIVHALNIPAGGSTLCGTFRTMAPPQTTLTRETQDVAPKDRRLEEHAIHLRAGSLPIHKLRHLQGQHNNQRNRGRRNPF